MNPKLNFQLLSLFSLLTSLLLSCGPGLNPDHAAEDWQQLFNGKNLEGWITKIRGYEPGENFGNTFRVEDGLMTVGYEAYDTFRTRYGHIFYEEPFSYYRIRTRYRFVGEQANGGEGWAWRNSGIMVHGQTPESMLKDQDFPISIEVQLLGGPDEGERQTANLCTPGTHVFMADTLFTQHCISSSSQTYRGDQWVNVEVLVLGDSLIEHFVEGEKVLSYSKPQIGGGVANGYDPSVKKDGTLLTSGSISLQSESHPIQFESVELLNLEGCLDPKAKNYKSYLVKHNVVACVY